MQPSISIEGASGLTWQSWKRFVREIEQRMDRLAEGLEVMTRLIRSNEPASLKGRFYQLQEAHLLPRPQRATPAAGGFCFVIE